MNKRIIFEGLDNVGKGTQIKRLATFYAKKMITFHVLHYSAISNISPKESKQFSKKLYKDMFFMILNDKIPDGIITLDRSHIGENIYAPMYRNTSGDWIFDIELWFKLAFPVKWNNIYLITLLDSVDSLIKREDGESFSIDKDKKLEEIDRFVSSTYKSHINNKIIIDTDNKSKEEVHQEIIKFLNLEE